MNTLELYIQRNFNIENVVKGDDFQYDMCTNTLTYRLKCNDIQDIAFEEDIKEHFNYKVNHPFALSILHEIGHSLTLPKFFSNEEFEKQYEKITKEKEDIDKAIKELDDDDIRGYINILKTRYFRLTDESIATVWAVWFANEHPRVVEILEKLGEWAKNEENK